MVEKPHSFKSTTYNLSSIKTLHDMIPGYLPDLMLSPLTADKPHQPPCYLNTQRSLLLLFPLPRMPSPGTCRAVSLTLLRCLLKCHLLREALLDQITSNSTPTLLSSFSIPLCCFSFIALIIQHYLYMCMYAFVHTHIQTHKHTHTISEGILSFLFINSIPSMEQVLKECLLNSK